MLIFKVGVKLTDLKPQIVLAIMCIESFYSEINVPCVITSCNDGVHSNVSLHFSGNAVDIRTKNYPDNKHVLRDNIKIALGDNFDVVFEAEGTDNEHLHVEYDPK